MSKKIYFEAKVEYQAANQENGKIEKRVEYFILEQAKLKDTNYADTEKQIIAELRGYNNIGNVQVKGIKETNYVEVHETNDSSHERFKCKVDMFTTNPETGKRMTASSYYLVQAEDSKKAIERLDEIMDGIMVEYEIPNVALTPIVDVLFIEVLDDMME